MKALTVELQGRKLILLTGATNKTAGASKNKGAARNVEIEARDKLIAAALRDPDAIAFGYTSGQWVSGA